MEENNKQKKSRELEVIYRPVKIVLILELEIMKQ